MVNGESRCYPLPISAESGPRKCHWPENLESHALTDAVSLSFAVRREGRYVDKLLRKSSSDWRFAAKGAEPGPLLRASSQRRTSVPPAWQLPHSVGLIRPVPRQWQGFLRSIRFGSTDRDLSVGAANCRPA